LPKQGVSDIKISYKPLIKFSEMKKFPVLRMLKGYSETSGEIESFL